MSSLHTGILHTGGLQTGTLFEAHVEGARQLTAGRLNGIVNAHASTSIKPGMGYRMTQTAGGTTLNIIKRRSPPSSSATPCPFGKVITIEGTDPVQRGIAGGVIYCGDKNFNVEPQALDTAADGTWLVQIFLSCEVNRDDDNEIILPGIKTSTDTPEWNHKVWTDPTDYDDNENPAVSDGLGSVVIPIGKLKIADGEISFDPVGCGNVTIGQCGGTFSVTRA